MRLIRDFGVRAWLASIALLGFEAFMFMVTVLLYKAALLNVEVALSLVVTAGSSPLMAMAFYFGMRAGQQPPTPPAPPPPGGTP